MYVILFIGTPKIMIFVRTTIEELDSVPKTLENYFRIQPDEGSHTTFHWWSQIGFGIRVLEYTQAKLLFDFYESSDTTIILLRNDLLRARIGTKAPVLISNESELRDHLSGTITGNREFNFHDSPPSLFDLCIEIVKKYRLDPTILPAELKEKI